MAIIGKSGELLSYDSSRMIDELDLDIAEFGGHLIVDAVVRKINDVYFFYCGQIVDNVHICELYL